MKRFFFWEMEDIETETTLDENFCIIGLSCCIIGRVRCSIGWVMDWSEVDFDEALVANIANVPGDIREMPGIFANVRQSLRRRSETRILAGGCSVEQFL
ncbi:hypothetical protein TNCV_3657441 [Trichonephila clavipes]|nr:hypothetical protein TNCV_3657441 [Trichonephila clavipes]